MPWYFPWSDSIKKRACRYLLQHYLGNFLKEKLTLEQLSVDMYNGTGTIHDVQLDVASLNEALDNYNVPIEIVDGYIGSICITIPWSALVTDSTIAQVQSLELTIQPKQRSDSACVMLDSMFSSMTTSMQLAEQCFRQEPTEGEQCADSAQPFQGLEMFAQTIEAVLSRIKLSFVDTIVRLEHLGKEAQTGAALEVRIERIEYFDDQATTPGILVDQQTPGGRNIHEPAAISHKNFHLMGMTIYCDEFPASSRTVSRMSSMFDSQTSSPDLHKSGVSGTSPVFQMPQQADSSRSTGAITQQPVAITADKNRKDSEPIKIAVLMGRHELKLKIKQKEELPGPKLELDGQFGKLDLHLSPRQVHLLLEIANGLASPGLCDDSNLKPRGSTSKPMEPVDFERIEHELQREMQHGRLQTHRADRREWPEAQDDLLSQSLNDSTEEMYYTLGAERSGPSSMESSVSSTLTNRTASTGIGSSNGDSTSSHSRISSAKSPKSKYRTQRPRDALQKLLLDDPAAELTQFKVKISFLSAIVLHEDPPSTPSDGIDPERTSADKLRNMAEKYFGRIQGINTSSQDLVSIREQYSEVCQSDHLGGLFKPITVECRQTSSSAMSSNHIEISVGMAEVMEAVYDRPNHPVSIIGIRCPVERVIPEYCELLTFVQDATVSPILPCIKLEVDAIERNQHTLRHKSQVPKKEMTIRLGKCQSEVDITIVDRIHALLNPIPLVPNSSNSSSVYGYRSYQESFTQAIEESPDSDQKVDLKVECAFLTLRIRFPIPDLRSEQCHNKPWWRRNLREETLILEFSGVDVQTTINNNQSMQMLEFMCKEAHGLLEEGRLQEPKSFIRIRQPADSCRENREQFDRPRMVLKFYPQNQSVLDDVRDEIDDITPHDSLNGVCQFPKREPSPFSSRKVMYENEEMVMPGEKQEISDFQDRALSNTLTTIELILPNVGVFLYSKDFLELIYNRLINDMILWEPQAPAPINLQDPHASVAGDAWGLTPGYQEEGTDRFLLCKSGIHYDNSSDSEEESGLFYSILDRKHGQKRKPVQERQRRQNRMCVTTNIMRGRITACIPLKDAEGKTVEDRCGQLVLDVEDGNIFTVANHDGDPDLQYICIHSHGVRLCHRGSMPWPDKPSVDMYSDCPPVNADSTIYLSEPGVQTKLTGQVGCGGDSLNMLSVAIKIKTDSVRKSKEYQVALGLRGATLRHKAFPTGQAWYTQMLELLNLVDFPIDGYTLPQIVTELHTHLWSCAIDYRPLHLPLRAMLTVEAFSVSSNIIAESPTSLLRFLIDEAALYIAPDKDKRSNPPVDLKKNYVCVVDVCLFELSLRTSDGKDPKYPKLDLRASNNKVHIRTCSDSCRALGDLLNHLANNSDAPSSMENTDTFKDSSSVGEGSLSDSPTLTQSSLEQVHDMMADAMRESSSSANESSSSESSPVKDDRIGGEVFFMADKHFDGGKSSADVGPVLSSCNLESVPSFALDRTQESIASSTMSMETEHFSADEEFCIIDNPGLGIAPRNGEPVIKVLTSEPIRIIDKHFSLPQGKIDQLKSPENFPQAVYRYSLREMSVIWYMYGGRDFPSTANKGAGPPNTRGRGKSDRSSSVGGWQSRGGPDRNVGVLMELHLNKVRLQNEIFPDNTTQASRQILLISDVEIRDRLASSKINKFLYQYTSGSMPKQSHANMLVIKAVHERPDPTMTSQECSLKVSLQPLRLNVDQDALFFLRTFFTELAKTEPDKSRKAKVSTSDCPGSPAPVLRVTDQPDSDTDPQELLIMFDEIDESGAGERERLDQDCDDQSDSSVTAQPVFFKTFVFSPDAPIRLDYQGKRVDMAQGALAGFLAGLAQLNCSELKLKRLKHRQGLLGVDRLVMYALTEWLHDIKRNQLPSILGGVGPMHSFVQLVQGVKDLFWLPVEQYRKDGRIVRGLQRGAHSFMTSTAMSALELTNKLVQTIQFCAEVAFAAVTPVRQLEYHRDRRNYRAPGDLRQGLTNAYVVLSEFAGEVAYDMLSPGPSVRSKKYLTRERFRVLTQPTDFREGVANAYTVLSEGIRGTAENIVKVAVEEHEQKGVSGAVGGVLRQIPPTVLQPVIIASEATSSVLGGMRNQLLPDKKREDEEKWRNIDS